ncbi:hypothetical protein RJT34_22842 [Clitoria ternatea]|uniref:Uncharacterized protein n=1 Tax=Clitoria ternatea TaxID=43366 RepID=A0AAN9IHV1_CLITE
MKLRQKEKDVDESEGTNENASGSTYNFGAALLASKFPADTFCGVHRNQIAKTARDLMKLQKPLSLTLVLMMQDPNSDAAPCLQISVKHNSLIFFSREPKLKSQGALSPLMRMSHDLTLSSDKAAQLKHVLSTLDDLSSEELGAKIKEYKITAPDTKNPLFDPYPFNLMFQTFQV